MVPLRDGYKNCKYYISCADKNHYLIMWSCSNISPLLLVKSILSLPLFSEKKFTIKVRRQIIITTGKKGSSKKGLSLRSFYSRFLSRDLGHESPKPLPLPYNIYYVSCRTKQSS